MSSGLGQSSIIKSANTFSPSYVPNSLPHREKALSDLKHVFGALYDDHYSPGPIVLIQGRWGVGKTAVSLRFSGDFVSETREGEKNTFGVHYVNCRKCRSPVIVIHEILSRFYPGLPQRGVSFQELFLALEKALSSSEERAFIVLDELNYLKDCGDLVYNLFRIHEGSEVIPPPIILIIRDWLPQYLVESNVRGFISLRLPLEPYNKHQLFDILKSRAELALNDDSCDEKVLELIAELATKEGNARYAIRLLHQAAFVAEGHDREEILPEDVRTAEAQGRPSLNKESIGLLPLHERLLLLGISRALNKSNSVWIPIGTAEREYQLACEEYGIAPNKHTAVWRKVNESLAQDGLIETRKSGKGFRGQTTLISITSLPTQALERMLGDLLNDSLG